jgi:formate--tetrahydrofolate ligase
MHEDATADDPQPTLPSVAVLAARLDLPEQALEPWGPGKAKLSLQALAGLAGRTDRPDGALVLVTAISPTPAGEGKTTTVIGLGDALNRLGRRALVCLRQPSLGPVFGMKGGATGGGRAQLVPSADINLHFTGDFAAVAAAHNLLAALIDNHVHHGNTLGIDVRRIAWKRVVDMNDRALRQITVGLGGPANGYPREDGFDIVAASEVMAILCLAASLDDLKSRLGDIVVAYTRDRRPVQARALAAHGAMAALLRDAFKPNLVQTLEGHPALVHGGPFANIAHGCNSLVALRAALKLGGPVITEAGFGADLGAEKFINILCRTAGLRPAAAVLVATVRALKFHGGMAVADLAHEDLGALQRGLANLERHLHNLREHHGLRCVVAINHFASDTDAELLALQRAVAALGAPVAVARHWAEGGAGALDLARALLDTLDQAPATPLRFSYDDADTLWDKVQRIATRVYGAAGVSASAAVRAQIAALQQQGYGRYPVCIAKTPYSFSTDPALLGAPSGHPLDIREVRLAAGARFVVMVCGEIMTMPGLPHQPAAAQIDLLPDGRIVGLA